MGYNKGYEYFPTRSCSELLPVIKSLGEWGMRWARSNLTERDYDVELLMLYLKRSINPKHLIGDETVIRFKFTDIKEYPDWWMVVTGNEIDVCVNDPGKNVDVYITTTVITMAEVWMGQINYRKAVIEDKLKVVGPKALTGDLGNWMATSVFADIAPASEIL
ncbi:MAG: SCP2 sterol-binding domain-containing protein [Gammaproteobacteria bacterium]|nr:SCP2 sterol-binding domain-containing protein [Gammaproteobacteria bacterium]